MGAILRLLGGSFGSYAIAAVAAAFVALGAYAVVQRLEVASLTADLAKAEAANVGLVGAVERQNGEVERMGRECQAKADAAVADALRALSVPEPPAAGDGPDNLNRWLRARLSR